MPNHYSRGDTVRLFLDIVNAGVGVTAQSPTLALQRVADGKWLQASDSTWQETIVDNPMTETDPANLPGRYHFDFDHTLDDLAGTKYTVKKVNLGGNARLEYEDLIFGPVASTVAPNICAITGTIYTPDGKPARAEQIRATLVPIFKDGYGRGIQSDRVILAMTDDHGDFSIPLVQGAVFRLEIPAIGYDRKITVPAAPTALFTDL